MLKKNLLGTLVEVCLIVIISAAVGLVWNRSLLTGAWRGELTQQAQAAPPQGELLPMPIGMVQVKELHDAKQAILVDARSADSFAQGHIAGATTLPLEEARKNPTIKFKQSVAKDATIIAYCNGFSCHDSMDLGKLLMQAGYTAVYVYEGGFPEWRDAGYPVAKGGV